MLATLKSKRFLIGLAVGVGLGGTVLAGVVASTKDKITGGTN